MSLNSACAGFGSVLAEHNLFFRLPVLNVPVYIGQPMEGFLKSIRCQKGFHIRCEKDKHYIETHPQGQFIACITTTGMYICGIVAEGISNQAHVKLINAWNNKKYLTNFRIDGYCIWLKSDNEVKLKEQTGTMPCRDLQSSEIGVEAKKVTRNSAKIVSSLINSINDSCYVKEQTPKPMPNQVPSRIKTSTLVVPKKPSPIEELEGRIRQVKQEWNTMYNEYVQSCQRFGSQSASSLENRGYIKKNNLGLYELTGRGDTYVTRSVLRTKRVKRMGADPSSLEWFNENGIKYHYAYVDSYEDVTELNLDLQQARNWCNNSADYRACLTDMYSKIKSLQEEKEKLESSVWRPYGR